MGNIGCYFLSLMISASVVVEGRSKPKLWDLSPDGKCYQRIPKGRPSDVHVAACDFVASTLAEIDDLAHRFYVLEDTVENQGLDIGKMLREFESPPTPVPTPIPPPTSTIYAVEETGNGGGETGGETGRGGEDAYGDSIYIETPEPSTTTTNPPGSAVNAFKSCVECPFDLNTCIQPEKWCDTWLDCPGYEDENNAECHADSIGCMGENQFLCQDGSCISIDYVCDGKIDCGDGSDERNCANFNCTAGELKCKNYVPACDFDECDICLDQNHICNGLPDCTDQSDESNCDWQEIGK